MKEFGYIRRNIINNKNKIIFFWYDKNYNKSKFLISGVFNGIRYDFI